MLEGWHSAAMKGKAAKKPTMTLMATTRFLLLSSIETPQVILQGCLTHKVLVFYDYSGSEFVLKCDRGSEGVSMRRRRSYVPDWPRVERSGLH
jgi:hypothetical protein